MALTPEDRPRRRRVYFVRVAKEKVEVISTFVEVRRQRLQHQRVRLLRLHGSLPGVAGRPGRQRLVLRDGHQLDLLAPRVREHLPLRVLLRGGAEEGESTKPSCTRQPSRSSSVSSEGGCVNSALIRLTSRVAPPDGQETVTLR